MVWGPTLPPPLPCRARLLPLSPLGSLLPSTSLPPSLPRLPLSGSCSGLTEAELRCPQLSCLSLKGCGSLRRLRLDCPALAALDATFCGDLDDAGRDSGVGCVGVCVVCACWGGEEGRIPYMWGAACVVVVV